MFYFWSSLKESRGFLFLFLKYIIWKNGGKNLCFVFKYVVWKKILSRHILGPRDSFTYKKETSEILANWIMYLLKNKRRNLGDFFLQTLDALKEHSSKLHSFGYPLLSCFWSDLKESRGFFVLFLKLLKKFRVSLSCFGSNLNESRETIVFVFLSSVKEWKLKLKKEKNLRDSLCYFLSIGT